MRPHIRSAIREYQTKLIERVKEDIAQLQAKFTSKKVEDKAKRVAESFDLPPLTAQITWIRQIERQLSMYMKRVEDVLGEGWANHMEGCDLFVFFIKHFIGRELKKDGDNFRQQLNTEVMFNDWCVMITGKNITMTGKLYAFDKQQRDGKIFHKIRVNYSPESIVIAKEVRLNQLMIFLPSALVFLGMRFWIPC